jgi:HrpA-like RNA helicase
MSFFLSSLPISIFNNEPMSFIVLSIGWEEIAQVHFALTSPEIREGEDNVDYLEDIQVHCLHSQMDMSNQYAIFRPPKEGKRKVILRFVVLF